MEQVDWERSEGARMRMQGSLVIALVVAALASVLRGQEGAGGAERPVKIVVLDSITREPVDDFTYEILVRTPADASREQLSAPVRVRDTSGSFTIAAPASCEIRITVRAADYIYAYPGVEQFAVRSDDPARTITIHLHPGVQVIGRVIDEHGAPVQGAWISPLVFTPPGQGSDYKKAVVSGGDGRFSLRGANPEMGISVEHPDFERSGASIRSIGEGGQCLVTIRLERGESVFGTVVDRDGAPIEGALVEDGSGKWTRSGPDGAYRLNSVTRWAGRKDLFVEVKREGFVRQTLTLKDIPEGGLRIVMERVLGIQSRVVGPDGSPVGALAYMAGPGEYPPAFECDRGTSTSADGTFSTHVEAKEKNWLAIRAEGFAPFQTRVTREGAGEQKVITLDPGVTVRGRVALAGHPVENGIARLFPARPYEWEYSSEGNKVAAFLSIEVPIAADGTFEIPHAGVGRQWLEIRSANASWREVCVMVTPSGGDLGEIAVEGTGTVWGIARKRDGSAWAFADGEVRAPPHSGMAREIKFKTDEDGRFRVEGVPAGLVYVGIPIHLSADMVGSEGMTAWIAPDRELEVNINGQGEAPKTVIQLLAMDGTRETLNAAWNPPPERKVQGVTDCGHAVEKVVRPLGRTTSMVPEKEDRRTLQWESTMTIPSLSEGEYVVELYDVQGRVTDTPVAEIPLTVTAERDPVTARLAVGGIHGRFVKPDGKKRRVTCVWAVRDEEPRTSRFACADDRGNFAARFLPDGVYTVYAIDQEAGWARVPGVEVRGGWVDVGDRALTAGGTIVCEGEVSLGEHTTQRVDLRFEDGKGGRFMTWWMAPYTRSEDENAGSRIPIQNLWPGEWSVTALIDGVAVVKGKTRLEEGRDATLAFEFLTQYTTR